MKIIFNNSITITINLNFFLDGQVRPNCDIAELFPLVCAVDNCATLKPVTQTRDVSDSKNHTFIMKLNPFDSTN